MEKPIKIAVDAMGGDNSPSKIIKGIKIHYQKSNNTFYNIFGDQKIIEPLLKKSKIKSKIYNITHTENYIKDTDSPLTAAKKGKNSSMWLAVESLKNQASDAIVSAGNTVALFVIIISYMVSVAPLLTAYTIIPLPILSYLIFKLSKKINIKSKKVQESLSRITTFTQESFSGISVIKSNTIEKEVIKSMMNRSEDTKQKNIDLAKFQSWFFPMMLLLIGVSNIIVIYIGGKQYINNEIDLGVLAEFIIYVTMLTWPVATVGWVTSIVQQAEASQKRINEFLKEKSKISNKCNKKYNIEGKVEFKNITLVYPETKIIALNKLNFEINTGKSLGIIGNVGSGKSTIAELILRNYDPDKGEVRIDGKNIKSHNLNILPRTTSTSSLH